MNGIATITIDGKQVALKFGLPALQHVIEKAASVNIMRSDSRYNELGLSHILYGGYKNDCIRKDIPIERPFNEFYDYVENIFDEQLPELQTAITAFDESKFVQDLIKQKKTTVTMRPNESL